MILLKGPYNLVWQHCWIQRVVELVWIGTTVWHWSLEREFQVSLNNVWAIVRVCQQIETCKLHPPRRVKCCNKHAQWQHYQQQFCVKDSPACRNIWLLKISNLQLSLATAKHKQKISKWEKVKCEKIMCWFKRYVEHWF